MAGRWTGGPPRPHSRPWWAGCCAGLCWGAAAGALAYVISGDISRLLPWAAFFGVWLLVWIGGSVAAR